MNSDIKIYHQGLTQFCTSFAFAHWFAIYLTTKEKVRCDVNPWPIVINSFRYKGYPVFNRSLNPFEVFRAIKRYGVTYKVDGKKKKYFPSGDLHSVDLEDVKDYLKSGPLLAQYSQHEIVVVKDMEFGYEIIDSLSKYGRRTIKPALLSNFQTIS